MERSARKPPGARCCRSSVGSSCSRSNQELKSGRCFRGGGQDADIAIGFVEWGRFGGPCDDYAFVVWRGRSGALLCVKERRGEREGDAQNFIRIFHRSIGHIKKICRVQVSIASRFARVDRRNVDHRVDLRGGPISWVADDCSGDVAEFAFHVGNHHVANAETRC